MYFCHSFFSILSDEFGLLLNSEVIKNSQILEEASTSKSIILADPFIEKHAFVSSFLQSKIA
jgi:hypothetical protein